MRYIVIILWIACLGACNPDVKQKVTVNGKPVSYTHLPGQVAELDVRRPGACVRMSEVSVEQLVAWKKGLFCFRQTSLPDILKQVARYYDVHFMNLEDAEGEAYTGDISRNVSLEVLLGAISAQTTDIQFKIVNRTVYITKKRD